MVAVNYGPVVTMIRDWRAYSWIHTTAHTHTHTHTHTRPEGISLIRELEKTLTQLHLRIYPSSSCWPPIQCGSGFTHTHTCTRTHAHEQLACPDGATHIAQIQARISFIDLYLCSVSVAHSKVYNLNFGGNKEVSSRLLKL